MAISIKPDGTITVDNADELRTVLSVREQLAAKPPTPEAKAEAKVVAAPPPPPPREPLRSPVDLFRPGVPLDVATAFRRLYEDAAESPQQQKLIQVLLSPPPRMFTDTELRTVLALHSNIELRGLLIGIIRRANNRGLPSPIAKDMVRHGRAKRSYRYSASGEFRRAMDGYQFRERVAV